MKGYKNALTDIFRTQSYQQTQHLSNTLIKTHSKVDCGVVPQVCEYTKAIELYTLNEYMNYIFKNWVLKQENGRLENSNKI